jgi:hypothetical protein
MIGIDGSGLTRPDADLEIKYLETVGQPQFDGVSLLDPFAAIK